MYSEKRRHRRIDCSGGATMQVSPNGTAVRARVLDVSVEGCLLQFLKTPKLEIEQTVDLTFTVNNLPFHVLAQVRSLREHQKVGLQFPQLRERIRLQLEDLVDELRYTNSRNYPYLPSLRPKP